MYINSNSLFNSRVKLYFKNYVDAHLQHFVKAFRFVSRKIFTLQCNYGSCTHDMLLKETRERALDGLHSVNANVLMSYITIAINDNSLIISMHYISP